MQKDESLWNKLNLSFYFVLQILMILLWVMMDSPSLKRGERSSQDTQMRESCICYYTYSGSSQETCSFFCELIIRNRICYYRIVGFFGNIYSTQLFNDLHVNLATEPSKRPRKFLVETSTLPTLMQTPMTRVKKRKRTSMRRAGTDPRNRSRGGRVERASLSFMSPVSWKAVTWLTRIMRSVLQTCLKGFRWVHLSDWTLVHARISLNHYPLKLCKFLLCSYEPSQLNLLKMMSWRRKLSGYSDMASLLSQYQCRCGLHHINNNLTDSKNTKNCSNWGKIVIVVDYNYISGLFIRS